MEDKEKMKITKITFELDSKTSVKVLHNGTHVGNIWSQSKDGSTPYPHNDNPSTLESIQICGFVRASEIWSCGIFTGTKDIVVRFNPMKDKYYDRYKSEYKDYVDKCFRIDSPEMIKSFHDWCSHMGYPKAAQLESPKSIKYPTPDVERPIGAKSSAYHYRDMISRTPSTSDANKATDNDDD